jgi:hypothetical protein
MIPATSPEERVIRMTVQQFCRMKALQKGIPLLQPPGE